MTRKINPGGPSRLYSSWLKGNLVIGGGDCGPAEEYFVAKTGNARNDGLSWERPKLTIQQGLDLCGVAGATTVARGTTRVYVGPGYYTEDLTTPLNAVAPFGQLIGYNPTPGRSYGATCIAGTSTAALIVQARGWLISGIEFDAAADQECVILGGVTAGNNAAGTMFEDCLFCGQNQGLVGIDWQSSIAGNPLVTIRNCGFYGFTSGATAGTCLSNTLSGIDQPRFALIEHCWFADSDNLIDMNPRGFKESIIRYNTFFTNGANQNPDEIIDNTGGNDTIVYGNYFPGAYTAAGGYVTGTNDEWAGNLSVETYGQTVGDPA